MSNLNLSRAILVGMITESVGCKTGLALSREKAGNLLGPRFRELWEGEDDRWLRIPSIDYAELYAQLLYKVGYTSSPEIFAPWEPLYDRYKNDPDALKTLIAAVYFLDPQEGTLAIMVDGVEATLGADHSGDAALTSSELGKKIECVQGVNEKTVPQPPIVMQFLPPQVVVP